MDTHRIHYVLLSCTDSTTEIIPLISPNKLSYDSVHDELTNSISAFACCIDENRLITRIRPRHELSRRDHITNSDIQNSYVVNICCS